MIIDLSGLTMLSMSSSSLKDFDCSPTICYCANFFSSCSSSKKLTFISYFLWDCFNCLLFSIYLLIPLCVPEFYFVFLLFIFFWFFLLWIIFKIERSSINLIFYLRLCSFLLALFLARFLISIALKHSWSLYSVFLEFFCYFYNFFISFFGF